MVTFAPVALLSLFLGWVLRGVFVLICGGLLGSVSLPFLSGLDQSETAQGVTTAVPINQNVVVVASAVDPAGDEDDIEVGVHDDDSSMPLSGAPVAPDRLVAQPAPRSVGPHAVPLAPAPSSDPVPSDSDGHLVDVVGLDDMPSGASHAPPPTSDASSCLLAATLATGVGDHTASAADVTDNAPLAPASAASTDAGVSAIAVEALPPKGCQSLAMEPPSSGASLTGTPCDDEFATPKSPSGASGTPQSAPTSQPPANTRGAPQPAASLGLPAQLPVSVSAPDSGCSTASAATSAPSSAGRLVNVAAPCLALSGFPL